MKKFILGVLLISTSTFAAEICEIAKKPKSFSNGNFLEIECTDFKYITNVYSLTYDGLLTRPQHRLYYL